MRRQRIQNPLLSIPSRVPMAPRMAWEESLTTHVRGGEGEPQAQLCRKRSVAPAPAALRRALPVAAGSVGELNPSHVTG